MPLAEHTANTLDQSGAQVVVLARIGQNLSEYGLRYSHLGLAYRDGNGNGASCTSSTSAAPHAAVVYRQGLGEFFLDDLYEYEAAVVVPAPEVQAKLLPALRDNARLAQLNTPAYSMVAYPWSQTYQQSNQWALETLAMAQDPAASDARARAGLAAAAGLPADDPAHLGVEAPRRAPDGGQHRLRRPPEREAIHGPHRNRHGRFGVRVVESHRPGRAGAGHPVDCAHDRTAKRTQHEPERTRHPNQFALSSSNGASRRSSGPSSSAPATTTCSSSRSP